jgi:hypothetical protein
MWNPLSRLLAALGAGLLGREMPLNTVLKGRAEIDNASARLTTAYELG